MQGSFSGTQDWLGSLLNDHTVGYQGLPKIMCKWSLIVFIDNNITGIFDQKQAKKLSLVLEAAIFSSQSCIWFWCQFFVKKICLFSEKLVVVGNFNQQYYCINFLWSLAKVGMLEINASRLLGWLFFICTATFISFRELPFWIFPRLPFLPYF